MKYSHNQIRHMASTALQAKSHGDPRYSRLVQMLQQRTGMSVEEIDVQIMFLAMF
jgi:hypothetical protein